MSAAAGFAKTAREVAEFRRKAGQKQARMLVRELKASASRHTGGDRAFSGLDASAKLGAGIKTEQGSRSTIIRISPSPKKSLAQWRWIEDGTAPGQRGRRRPRYYHPGTRSTQGVNAWSSVGERLLPRIEVELAREFSTVLG